MKTILQTIAVISVTGFFIVAGAALALDALEFEQTGKCSECLVLNKVRDL